MSGSANVGDLPRSPAIVRGVRAIARAIGRSRGATHRALVRGDLPATLDRAGRWIMAPGLQDRWLVATRLAALRDAPVSAHSPARPQAAPGGRGVASRVPEADRGPSPDMKKGGKGGSAAGNP